MIKIKLQLEKVNKMNSKQKIIYTKNCLEFLDYKCVSPNDKDFRIYEGKNSVIPSMVDANFNDGFLNNWNWIMEVKDMIQRKFYFVDILGCGICTIKGIEGKTKNPHISAASDEPKEAVVEAINQFLIWYYE